MTKKEKNELNKVLSMSYDEIIHNLYNNSSEMRSATRLLSKEFNKMTREMRKNPIGKLSPAYKHIEKLGIKRLGIAKIGTMNYNDLMKQFWLTRNYLKSSTGSLEGFMSYRENIASRLGGRIYHDEKIASSKNKEKALARAERLEKKFWKIYDKLVDMYGGVIKEQASNQVQEQLAILMEDKNLSQNQNALIEMMQSFIARGLQYGDSDSFNSYDSYYKDMTKIYGKDIYNKNRKRKTLKGSRNR